MIGSGFLGKEYLRKLLAQRGVQNEQPQKFHQVKGHYPEQNEEVRAFLDRLSSRQACRKYMPFNEGKIE